MRHLARRKLEQFILGAGLLVLFALALGIVLLVIWWWWHGW